MTAINFSIKKRNRLSCYYYQPCEYLRMILFTSVFWINLIFLTLFRNCMVWMCRKLKISIMYVGNVRAWKDWGRDITDCTDNQVLLASFWGASHHSLVKHCVALCLSRGMHLPEAVNILCLREVQGNLHMLRILVREVLVISGKIIFSHISERQWAMLKTTGGRYQRATSFLLLKWKIARLSYKSDGANKVTFLDTLIQTTEVLKDWDFELDYVLS